jgi:hypothetical protein
MGIYAPALFLVIPSERFLSVILSAAKDLARRRFSASAT